MVVTTRISFHKCRESFLKMWRVCRIEGSFQAVPLEDLATAVKIARNDIGVNETLREPTKRRLISVGVLSLSKRASMKRTTADDDSRQIQFFGQSTGMPRVAPTVTTTSRKRSEEHTSELQSRLH